MVEFRCTLTAEAVTRLYSVLSCLAKFHEILGLDITERQLTLLTLNSSKTSSASVSLSGNVFFQSFYFSSDDATSSRRSGGGGSSSSGNRSQFRCQLYNKSLQSVFKTTKGAAVAKDDDSAIERCEMVLQDEPERSECRLIVSMVARSGVRKMHKLTYEATEVPTAVFNKSTARSHWRMSAHMLKSFTEYFGARTELLDIYSENNKASFTSYTEKVMRGSEVLRQPLQTTIDIDTLDFSDFQVEDQVHVGVSVKDFRAIVTHADTLSVNISAYYSYPKRPLQLSYTDHGMTCEFTLATTGQYRGNGSQAANATRPPSVVPPQESRALGPVTVDRRKPASDRSYVENHSSRQTSEMPPPPSIPRSARTKKAGSTSSTTRAPPPVLSASVDEESLFVNEDDDDRRWDETAFDADEDQLGWNVCGDVSLTVTLSDPAQASDAPEQPRTLTQNANVRYQQENRDDQQEEESEIPPTQPMNGMHGLFD